MLQVIEVVYRRYTVYNSEVNLLPDAILHQFTTLGSVRLNSTHFDLFAQIVGLETMVRNEQTELLTHVFVNFLLSRSGAHGCCTG